MTHQYGASKNIPKINLFSRNKPSDFRCKELTVIHNYKPIYILTPRSRVLKKIIADVVSGSQCREYEDDSFLEYWAVCC
jgi:hypothetical protein